MFNFYKAELMDRYVYLVTQPLEGPNGLSDWIRGKFLEFDPNYNTTFGLNEASVPTYTTDRATCTLTLASIG